MIPARTWMGNLRLLEVYIDWDGPRLFSCMNERGEVYLACWIEDIDDHHRLWYVPISTDRLAMVRTGAIDIADAIREPERELVEVVLGSRDEPLLRIRNVSDVSEEDLPIRGDRLSCRTSLEAAIAAVQRELLSSKLQMDVVDVSLFGDSVAGHRIGFGPLRRFLGRWQDFMAELSFALHRHLDADIYAFSPGSFQVRLTGGGSGLEFTADTLRLLAVGSAAEAARTAIPSAAARSAFRQLADGLLADELGLAAYCNRPNGSRSSGSLPLRRLRDLKDTLSPHRTEARLAEVRGVLEAASVSGRRLTLSGERESYHVDVPRSTAYDHIKGKRIGTEYTLQVNELVVINSLGDEIEKTYTLAEEPDTERTDPELDLFDVPPTRPVRPLLPKVLIPSKAVVRWAKPLSATDALMTRSGTVYLRLTESRNVIGDPTIWFRDELFGEAANWERQRWGRGKAVGETANVPFVVCWPRMPPELHYLQVTHDPDRRSQHFAPVTWVHWDAELLERLRAKDYTGWWVTVVRDVGGFMVLTVQTAAPSWHGEPQPG